MHVLQTGIKNKLKIDVRARPVMNILPTLPAPLVNYICINLKFQLHVLVNEWNKINKSRRANLCVSS